MGELSIVSPELLSPAMSGTNYDEANEMLAFNSKNLTYDNKGNLLTKTDSCGTTTYTWDARNRLTNINGFTSTCTSLTASFSYDALGRRISKTINGTTTQFVYDGWDITQEIKAGVKTNYIRTLNIDEPLTRIQGSTVRHYVTDALGSVVALTDDAGATKTTYVYDAFGNATVSGEATDNPFQFAGRENDGTGLLYERNRYYSYEMLRYISEDPIRLAGGDVNFFSRVGSNPVNAIDPFGLVNWTGLGTSTVNVAYGISKITVGTSLITFGTAADVSGVAAIIGVPVQYVGTYQITTGFAITVKGLMGISTTLYECKSEDISDALARLLPMQSITEPLIRGSGRKIENNFEPLAKVYSGN